MYKSFKCRLYPTQEQEVLLTKHFNNCRFLWNIALETKETAYKSGVSYSRFDLQKQLVDLKRECIWLKEVSSQSLQCVLLDLDNAYKKFFNGAGFPKYKSKKSRESFKSPQRVKVFNDMLFISKFREGIKIKLHRPINGVIKSATISRTRTGKYFVSILFDTKEDTSTKPSIKENSTIGIDLGIKDFAVTSEGEIIPNPKYLRTSIDRLKVLQRRASKKKKGSNNRRKANLKVAKLHEKITNQRNDFLHKTSTRLIRENQTIALETLDISGMIVKGSTLSKYISDAGWYNFNRMLEYKADWYGKNILRIGRFEPSSKMCSCGVVNKELKLYDRIWKCNSCGRVNERDLLAAQNIKKFALKDYSGREPSAEPVEMSTLVESMKQETYKSCSHLC